MNKKKKSSPNSSHKEPLARHFFPGRADSGSTLLEALVLTVLLGTVGLLVLGMTLDFSASTLRSGAYQQRQQGLEQLSGFANGRILAAQSNDLGIGVRSPSAYRTYSEEVQADNPRVYYPLNETSGTTISNASPVPPPIGNIGISGLNGVISGSYALNQTSLIYQHFSASNKWGTSARALPNNRSVRFSATSGMIRSTASGQPANFNLPSDSFTLEFWVRQSVTSALGNRGFIQRATNSGQSYAVGTAQSSASVGLYNAGSFLRSNLFRNSTTTHYVVITRSGTELDVYINGQRQDAGSASTTALTELGNSGYLQLGGFNIPGLSATGSGNIDLDEVAIYPTALSEERVEAHYRAASRETEPLSASAAGINPLTLAGDQLIFKAQGICYRLIYQQAEQHLALASYNPASNGESASQQSECYAIRATRGPNQPSGPSDPVLDNPGSAAFNYQILASNVLYPTSSEPFSYFNPQGQKIVVDQQANSASNNPVYQQISSDFIDALQINVRVGASENKILTNTEVAAQTFSERYQLGLLCPR